MKTVEIIQNILSEQMHSFTHIPADIRLSNGNILLRSFRIYEVDLDHQHVVGLTLQEEYAHTRENREPVYCTLKLSEIKEILCPELDIYYPSELTMARV
jgi:hypothetical protein